MGELALWVALLMAAWGAIVSFAGGRAARADLIASGVRAIYAAFVCVVLATSGLLVALVSSDFAISFVASFTSSNLPLGYKVAALWSGPPGSLLLCTLALSTCSAMAVASTHGRDPQATPFLAGSCSVILLLFVATLCFAVNPYERTIPAPVDGQGMHPLFQHPGFVHPPVLYLALSAASVPFALTVAALGARSIDNDWILTVRRWSIVSWFFLTIGMLAGMWWAYVEVADVGHWALDPVRNLSILSWLTTSALLYSTRRHESRGVFGRESMVFAALSFLLGMLGMFIVRGGIVSMNSVASWSTVADAFTAVLAPATLLTAYLLVMRLPQLATPRPPTSGLSGKRRRYGAYAVGLGLVMLVIAIAGNLFRKETDIALGSGETATITDPFGDRRQLTSQGISRFDVVNRHVVAVALQAARDGKTSGLITSEERQYIDSRGAHTFNPSIEAGIDYSLKQDTYVVLTGVTGDRAQLRIAFNPLVTWVWIGGAMIAIGGAVAMWPS